MRLGRVVSGGGEENGCEDGVIRTLWCMWCGDVVGER